MPFLTQIQIQENIFLGIWKIDNAKENLDFFLNSFILNQKDEFYLEKIKNTNAKIRCLASRLTLKIILENQQITYNGISHTPEKKPFLAENPLWHISISHTEDYCGAVISYKKFVGLDLEKAQYKLQKISHKFLHETEKNAFFPENLPQTITLQNLTQIWASKEAMYKLYGKKNMIFKDDLAILTLQPENPNPHENLGRFFDKNQQTWLQCALYNHCWEDVWSVVSILLQ